MMEIVPREVHEELAMSRINELEETSHKPVNQRLLDLLSCYPLETQVGWMSELVRIAPLTKVNKRRYELPAKILVNELMEKGGIHGSDG